MKNLKTLAAVIGLVVALCLNAAADFARGQAAQPPSDTRARRQAYQRHIEAQTLKGEAQLTR